MPPEPNPYEPPRAPAPPARSTRRALLWAGLIGPVATLSLTAGVIDLEFLLPIRHYYFPGREMSWDYAQAWSFVGVGAIGLVGSCGAFALRRVEARRPACGGGNADASRGGDSTASRPR